MASANNGSQILQWFLDKVERLTDETKDVIRDGAEEGAEITKRNISTRGTQKSGKRGRIETAYMLNSVGSEVRRESPEEIEAAFGWIKDREDYFLLQEGGFLHPAGVTVEGMYAITDAAEEIRMDIERKIGQVARRV